MESKLHTKIKWAVALLIVRVVGSIILSIATIGNLSRLLGIELDSLSGYFLWMFTYEQLPTIAAIVLIFVDKHNQSEGLTAIRKWIIALTWTQHFYAMVSYSLAGVFGSVFYTWIGGCLWIGLITYLLCSAWKNPVSVEANRQAVSTGEKPFTDSWAFLGVLIAILLVAVFIIVLVVI